MDNDDAIDIISKEIVRLCTREKRYRNYANGWERACRATPSRKAVYEVYVQRDKREADRLLAMIQMLRLAANALRANDCE